MLLKNLFQNIKIKRGVDFPNADIEICGVSRDSKTVKNGEVFFCLKEDFEICVKRCEEALQNGASFVVSNISMPFDNSIEVEDCRKTFSLACANFYEHACDDLTIIGITGTNGKTTTSHVVAHMLKTNGKNVGVIGTNGVFYNGKTFPCPLTTPDADFLHKTFLEMKRDGVEFVIMEVSAHAIAQKRVEGIVFEIGVLTNITQDHLDYFKTFEFYEKTKLGFFNKKNMKKAIVCGDDKSALKLIDNCDVPISTYGIKQPCDVFAIDVLCSMNGTRFVANVCDEVVEIKTNLIGDYNVYNSLAALSICQKLGFDEKQLEIGLNFINPVEGRFNVINISGKYIVIDFAHSPDGLMNVLKTARTLTSQKLYVIFGCGGNRDKGKRPIMGQIAEKYADYVCLTDDNPRLEKSEDIISDIEKGMRKSHFVEPQREEAIAKMIDLARAGDIVVIAGKGAEKEQEIGTEKRAYNDFDAVHNYYKNLIMPKRNREIYDC